MGAALVRCGVVSVGTLLPQNLAVYSGGAGCSLRRLCLRRNCLRLLGMLSTNKMESVSKAKLGFRVLGF